MKNKELYNDKLVAMAISGNCIAKVDGRLTTCESTACKDCDWHNLELVCSEMRSIWADEEYKEDSFSLEPYDLYYFVDCDGCVKSDVYSSKSKYDRQTIEFGNACKDEDYIQRRAREIRLYNLLSNFAHQVNDGWEPDWDNLDEEKWYVYRSHSLHRWAINCCGRTQRVNEVYFRTKKLTQRAVEEIIIPFERGEL